MKKYFNWEELWNKYKKYQKAILQVVITGRNKGKSYATFAYVNEHGFSADNKVLILRNSQEELKHTKRDFANRFKDKLICSGDFIYDMKFKEILDESGNRMQIPSKNEVVGYFASINNYVNYKSLEAKDVKYIVYEEFNEDTVIGRNIYYKFFNILKTFERFNKLEYVFMLGNRDGFDSDFFINWNIIPSDDSNVSKITSIRDDYGLIGVVYDLGENEFENLDQEKTLSNRLANLDNRTAGFANGSYLKSHSLRVKNYKKILLDFKPMYYLAIDSEKYCIGKHEQMYALISPWNYQQDLNLPTFSFDIMSGLMNKSTILDEQDHLDLVDWIYKSEKNMQIFYDSYDSKNVIANLIFSHKKYLQK